MGDGVGIVKQKTASLILTRTSNVVGNQIIYKYGFLIEPATIDNIHNFQSSISLARRSDEETFRLSTPI